MFGIWLYCVIFVFINLENCYIALKKGVYLFPLKYRQQQYFISPHNSYSEENPGPIIFPNSPLYNVAYHLHKPNHHLIPELVISNKVF